MQRQGLRATVGGAKVDVPIGTWVAGQVLRYNGTTGLIDSMDGGVAGLERAELIGYSALPNVAGVALTSDRSYFVYLGRTMRDIVAKFVEFQVTTVGAGAQTAEVGVFMTAGPPDKAALSMVKIVATGTVDALTSNGVKRNTATFDQSISFGTHIWCGIRTAMATTQPVIRGLASDMAQGRIQSTSASGALTGAGPFAGAIIAAAVTFQAPDLRLHYS